MTRNPVQVLEKHTTHLGHSFVFHFGGVKPAIVSSEPAVMQHVLKTNHGNYRKSEIQMKRMGRFLGTGLLTSHGERWHTQRRLIQQGFSTAKLTVTASKMHECLEESLERFDRQVREGPVDIYPELMRITFRMVSRSIFSAALDDEDVEYISRTISTVQGFILRQVVQPYLDPWFALSGELRRHEAMRDNANRIVLARIRERRAHAGQHDDLLQILLDARYGDTGEGMSDESILGESLQLLLAGHETSSNALSWVLYLLSRHPGCIDTIRDEYDSVVGQSKLQFAHLPALDFTTQVVEESLRLYPPFWMVDRVAVADDQIMDLPIPRGTLLVLFIYGAHHSPRFWDDPERFIPARFSRENRTRHTPFAYVPFGGGPRGCIGGSYAMLQMLLILGAILRRYDCELAPNQDISARPMVILRPKNGIRMYFAPRRRSLP